MSKAWPYLLGLLALVLVLLFTGCAGARAQDSSPLQDRLLQSAAMAGGVIACGAQFDDEVYEVTFETVVSRIIAELDRRGLSHSPFDAFLVEVVQANAAQAGWVEKVGAAFVHHSVKGDEIACKDLVRRSLLYTQEPM